MMRDVDVARSVRTLHYILESDSISALGRDLAGLLRAIMSGENTENVEAVLLAARRHAREMFPKESDKFSARWYREDYTWDTSQKKK